MEESIDDVNKQLENLTEQMEYHSKECEKIVHKLKMKQMEAKELDDCLKEANVWQKFSEIDKKRATFFAGKFRAIKSKYR